MVEFLLGLLAGILITILAGLYFGKKIEEKSVYLHTIPYVEKSIHDKVGIRTSKYKYFRHATQSEENVNLYDLENDPQENINIASENPDIVKEMEKILEDFTKNSVTEEEKLTEEEEKIVEAQLKDLGYI